MASDAAGSGGGAGLAVGRTRRRAACGVQRAACGVQRAASGDRQAVRERSPQTRLSQKHTQGKAESGAVRTQLERARDAAAARRRAGGGVRSVGNLRNSGGFCGVREVREGHEFGKDLEVREVREFGKDREIRWDQDGPRTRRRSGRFKVPVQWDRRPGTYRPMRTRQQGAQCR